MIDVTTLTSITLMLVVSVCRAAAADSIRKVQYIQIQIQYCDQSSYQLQLACNASTISLLDDLSMKYN
jgi:hypothetical protein